MRRMTGLFLAMVLGLALLPATAVAGSVTWTRVDTLTVPGGMGDPYGVAVDKKGRVYAASEPSSALYMFDEAGDYVGSWGSPGTAIGQLKNPWSVACDRYGRVYVGERGSGAYRIQAFWPGMDPSQASIVGTSGGNPWNVYNPLGLTVSLGGDIYFTDNCDTVVALRRPPRLTDWWDPQGAPAMGAHADQDGNLWIATDQAFSTRTNRANSVLKFSPDGELLASWGGTNTATPPTNGLFSRPYDVAVDGGGRVFVSDMSARVQVFDRSGNFQSTFGYPTMSAPFSVAAGYDRRVYVAETYANKVTVWEQTPAVSTATSAVAGSNRYATAAAASKGAYPGGLPGGHVIVASGANWPDALGGASLAGALGAPLLLTNPSYLPGETAAEITRLGVSKAYLLGGVGAVSPAVFDALEALVGDGDVTRLGGTTRYETAATIASATIDILAAGGGYDGTAIVCTGKDFPDALSVAPLAVANRWPVYLTEPTTFTPAARSMMLAKLSNHGYVIGGTGAVSQAVADAIDPIWIGTPMRVFGANRYATSAAVADLGFESGLLWSRPALATGQDFPDALAGGVLQGTDCCPVLLTPKDSLAPSATAALTANRDMVYELRFLGGPGVLGPTPRASATALLH